MIPENNIANIKPTKLTTFMKMAEAASEQSHDAETKVGGVLVKKDFNSVIMTGYNGFAYGAEDELLPNTRPDKYDFIIHSEQNILMQCARQGISTDNCYLVCTLTPCSVCLRLLRQAGVTTVYAKEKYKDFDSLLNRRDIEVTYEITPEGYYKIEYSPRRNKSI
jgi:dCMP deaminase